MAGRSGHEQIARAIEEYSTFLPRKKILPFALDKPARIWHTVQAVARDNHPVLRERVLLSPQSL
jgi:hypothetical protein